MNTTTTTSKPAPIRGAAGEIETFAMANCLMLLNSHNAVVSSVSGVGNSVEEVGRMFACKTCDRKFSSFQALGGHRASHKKIKIDNSGEFHDDVSFPAKLKVHACTKCGVEFPTGQALGGHMRRHRAATAGGSGGGSVVMSSVTTENSIGNSDGNDGEKKRKINDVVSEVPVLKNTNSKRVCMDSDSDLDLNLSLWRNEDVDVDVDVEQKNDNDHHEVEEGEIVEQAVIYYDFLNLELRQPINY